MYLIEQLGLVRTHQPIGEKYLALQQLTSQCQKHVMLYSDINKSFDITLKVSCETPRLLVDRDRLQAVCVSDVITRKQLGLKPHRAPLPLVSLEGLPFSGHFQGVTNAQSCISGEPDGYALIRYIPCPM